MNSIIYKMFLICFIITLEAKSEEGLNNDWEEAILKCDLVLMGEIKHLDKNDFLSIVPNQIYWGNNNNKFAKARLRLPIKNSFKVGTKVFVALSEKEKFNYYKLFIFSRKGDNYYFNKNGIITKLSSKELTQFLNALRKKKSNTTPDPPQPKESQSTTPKAGTTMTTEIIFVPLRLCQ